MLYLGCFTYDLDLTDADREHKTVAREGSFQIVVRARSPGAAYVQLRKRVRALWRAGRIATRDVECKLYLEGIIALNDLALDQPLNFVEHSVSHGGLLGAISCIAPGSYEIDLYEPRENDQAEDEVRPLIVFPAMPPR
jgi:hypothetical protein